MAVLVYTVEYCLVCYAAVLRCGPQDVRRLSVLEGSDGFHLSDAMFFCRRGMEVISYNIFCTAWACSVYGINVAY